MSNNGVNQTWKEITTKSFDWSLSQTTSGDGGAADLVTQVTFRRSSPDGRIAQISATKPSLASQIATAQTLIRQKKLLAAETILQQSAAQYASQPRPHFLPGYVLHLQQKYDKAIEAYQHAAQFQQTKALASYNMACIHALRSESDQDFEHLSTAISSGSGTVAGSPPILILSAFVHMPGIRNCFRHSSPTQNCSSSHAKSFISSLASLPTTRLAGRLAVWETGIKTASSISSRRLTRTGDAARFMSIPVGRGIC